jgi:putative ABC transport system permease protein
MAWRVRFGKCRRDSELEEELQDHLQRQAKLHSDAGLTEQEAQRHARLDFGSVEAAKDACREERRGNLIETLFLDVRYGWRALRKSPGFALVAILILALGIGLNSAIFSTINAVLFADWPFHKPEHIVFVHHDTEIRAGWLTSVPDFDDYARQQKTFSHLALWMAQSVNLTGSERPERIVGTYSSANFFDMLDTHALLGRTFLAGEDQPGADYVAVISYGFWQQRFAKDPQVLGRRLILNNESYTIVGVLPANFRTPWESDVFITPQHHPGYSMDRNATAFLALGRIKDEATPAQAASDLSTIAHRLALQFPKSGSSQFQIELVPFTYWGTLGIRKPLLVLLAAVVLVLLIGCANLANLLLARGAARRHEIAVRAALGATRLRMARQLLSESVVIAFIGAVAGVLLAYWCLPLLLRVAPQELHVTAGAVLSGRALLYCGVLGLLTAGLFGALPAIQLSSIAPGAAMSSNSRGAQRLGGRGAMRSAFVVCQVAISIVLLIAATLTVRSFRALLATSPGFNTHELLTMEYRLPKNKYSTPEAQAAFHAEVVRRVRTVPGVTSAALVAALPFSGNWGSVRFSIPGRAVQPNGKEDSAMDNPITPDYLLTVRLPLLRGRAFTEHDDERSLPVAVVSRNFAERYWAGQDPLGKEIVLDARDVAPELAAAGRNRVTVVGIVGDTKQLSTHDPEQPQIYFPYAQQPGIFATLVVRTTIDPMSLAEPVRRAVWSLDKDQPTWKVRTVDWLIERDLAGDRFLTMLSAIFGALALVLSAMGTYALLSHSVAQRTPEIGVRMALGATAGSVRSMVLWQALKLLAAGSVIGIAAGFAVARLLTSLLYGVRPSDAVSFLAAWLAMTAVALIASYLPARRATRVDPMSALRCE